MSYHYRYMFDGKPLQTCPVCEHVLTAGDVIALQLAVGNSSLLVMTRLDSAGRLVDTPDRAVANGYHSATYCRQCQTPLIDIEGVDEEQHDPDQT